MAMNVRDAAIRILKKAGTPLHAKEIAGRIIDSTGNSGSVPVESQASGRSA